MIREPETNSEKEFIKQFGEKEFDTVIRYEEDRYTRQCNLMESMNSDESKMQLNLALENYCKQGKFKEMDICMENGKKQNSSWIPLNFIYSIEHIKDSETKYSDIFQLVGDSSNYAPLELQHLVRGIQLVSTDSSMCTNSSRTDDIAIKHLSPTKATDYHKLEDFFYFYARLALEIIPYSQDIETSYKNTVHIPMLDILYGEDKKEWIIQECKDGYIPSYPRD